MRIRKARNIASETKPESVRSLRAKEQKHIHVNFRWRADSIHHQVPGFTQRYHLPPRRGLPEQVRIFSK